MYKSKRDTIIETLKDLRKEFAYWFLYKVIKGDFEVDDMSEALVEFLREYKSKGRRY